MYRTLVILRYTFLESVLQPIFTLLLSLGGGILIIFGLLPFFTLGEDTKMFNSVGIDVILLLVLLATLFATSKSIFEEIEDRTMLTLMSKPVRRWEVMTGKYLGIILSAALGVAVLGAILMVCMWLRVPTDYQLNASSLNEDTLREVWEIRLEMLTGMVMQLFLTWLQVSVLAAVGVALSTRFSLVVNLPTVIILYFAGNLTRFLFPLSTGPLADKSPTLKGIVWGLSLVLPYLQAFDLKSLTLLGIIKVPGTAYANQAQGVGIGQLLGFVGISTLYALTYVIFVLCAGMLSFQKRELGGGEG